MPWMSCRGQQWQAGGCLVSWGNLAVLRAVPSPCVLRHCEQGEQPQELVWPCTGVNQGYFCCFEVTKPTDCASCREHAKQAFS